MGKGEIKSESGSGLYNVELILDTTRIDTRIAKLDDKINYYANKLGELNPDTDEYNKVLLKKTAAEKMKATLQAQKPSNPTLNLWCADKSEGMTGEVGIIEIPGERVGSNMNIQPDSLRDNEGAGSYSAARDGQLQPSVAGTPACVFYNWAMLPGWQRWKPTYRYGEITYISDDKDTCSVLLDNTYSSGLGQSLWINNATLLTAVQIDYMTCNGWAFQNGDRVIIKFENQSWDSPKVIGFEDNPVGCECPVCEDMEEPQCSIDEDETVTLYFPFDDFANCGTVFDAILSDGMPGSHAGTFATPTWDGGSSRWEVEYTSNATLCSQASIICPEICGHEFGCCFEFDDDNTDNTIACNGSVLCFILGGKPPFTWEVSGLGYSFRNETTSGRANYLDAAAGNCPTHCAVVAECQVTDDCGDIITFDIRNTGGGWVQREHPWFCLYGPTTGYIRRERNNAKASEAPAFYEYEGDGRWYLYYYGYAANALTWSLDSNPPGDPTYPFDWTEGGSMMCLEPGHVNPAEHPPPCGDPVACWQQGGGGNPYYSHHSWHYKTGYNRYKYWRWEC